MKKDIVPIKQKQEERNKKCKKKYSENKIELLEIKNTG